MHFQGDYPGRGSVASMGPPSDKGGYVGLSGDLITSQGASMGPPSDKGGYGPVPKV